MSNIEHLYTLARRKLRVGPDWQACRMEWVGDAMLIEGGVPNPPGPRGGTAKRWKGVETCKTVVTAAEGNAEEARYETETGKCGQCLGEKRERNGWSRDTGTMWVTCRRCKGTGLRG